MCRGGGGGGDPYAAQRAEEAARQSRVTSGVQEVNSLFDNQFTDDFYSGRTKAYNEYYAPQLDYQASDAQKKLTLALAKSGNLQGSAGARQMADLKRQIDLNKQMIANRALESANTARKDVENSRGELVRQINATGNSALSQAQAQAGVLASTPNFDPLPMLFQNVGSGVVNANSGYAAGSKDGKGFIPSLFDWGGSSGSSKVVN
jgi:hypothetical protein